MKYIKIKALPDRAAKQAYEEGFFVEAIQILHGFVENQARSCLNLVGSVTFGTEHQDSYELADTLSLYDTLKVLRILNQITSEEFSKFTKFNSLRNKIVHQLYKEPYEKVYLGVPKNEYDEVFNETLEQAYFFTRKCEDIVG